MVEITEIETCANDGCTNDASSGSYCSSRCQQRHAEGGGGGGGSTAAAAAAAGTDATASASPAAATKIPSTEQRSAPTAMQSMCRQLAEIAARELVESIGAAALATVERTGETTTTTTASDSKVKLSKSTDNVFGIEAPPISSADGEGDGQRRKKSDQTKAVRDLSTGQLIFFVYSEIYHQRLYYAVRESPEAFAQAPRRFESELVKAVTTSRLPGAFVEWCGRMLDDEAYFRKGHCLEMQRRGLLGKDGTVVNAESEAHWEMMARFRTYRS